MMRKFIDKSAPVQPDQYAVEFGYLLRLFRRRCPERVLEIGSAEGGTLFQWMKHIQRGGTVTAIDLPGSIFGKRGTERYAVDWPRWAEKFGVEMAYILGDSRSAASIDFAKQRGPYDFIFIDGDHRYTGVLADWLNYAGMARDGGVVVFHDILPHPEMPSVEVWQLWRDIRASMVTAEFISGVNQIDKGVGVVYV